MKLQEELIKGMEDKGVLKTPAIKNAFLKVDRTNFVIPENKNRAYEDRPLPIGEEQTISQPMTVAFMLELLQPKEGEIILDVGSGSGWTSALLAEIVGRQGKIFAIERIRKLKEFGEENVRKMGYENVTFLTGNGVRGWPEKARFDKILVNAAAVDIPPALTEQLSPGGKMVIPLDDARGSMVWLGKNEDGTLQERRFSGFAFVPLIDR
ncbi:MAG: protein-L-isoaspartate(D-aspartate) O-methyltransferase [Bacillota bacterium]|jgi:protein-L-isoaspartate(D-aspartate) O-methyltransferase|nr:protein-L-isoaspartate(D-aspartate) O-methyltransferase [Clostridia bacterium]